MKTIGCALAVLFLFIPTLPAEWKPHQVRQIEGRSEVKLPGRFQIVTESWNRVVAVPYIAYLPDKDRLAMLVSCDYPHHAMIVKSDDRGSTWTPPRYVHVDGSGRPDTGMGTGLAYLGNGRLLLAAGDGTQGDWVWFSSDHGESWTERALFPPGPKGLTFNRWDPPLVDSTNSSGAVGRLLLGGYTVDQEVYQSAGTLGYSSGGIRFSEDAGKTWSEVKQVPQWHGVNEVAFVRARNGYIVAACRTDWPKRFRKTNFDHYEGLSVSISEDNGRTWSRLQRLYDWGRMHPSLVVLPGGDIVMTYVVRKGYPDTSDGFPQFGIEAVVSRDNGRTWDLDRRYVLASWKGIRKGPNAWYASSQATSTVLLPDGSLLTAFGTGYRSVDSTGTGKPGPRDVGLVAWKPNAAKASLERPIANAPYDSRLRNESPDPEGRATGVYCTDQPKKQNIAQAQRGARVIASPNDGDPAFLFHNPHNSPILTLETLPAWVEIHWTKEQRMDEIHIHPGAPSWAGRPTTECVPLDYRLQFRGRGGFWLDLVPPVANAPRYAEFYGNRRAYLIQDREFVYVHRFPAISTKAVRLSIGRTSDVGKRAGSGDRIVVPEDRRETCLRRIEVFQAEKTGDQP